METLLFLEGAIVHHSRGQHAAQTLHLDPASKDALARSIQTKHILHSDCARASARTRQTYEGTQHSLNPYKTREATCWAPSSPTRGGKRVGEGRRICPSRDGCGHATTPCLQESRIANGDLCQRSNLALTPHMPTFVQMNHASVNLCLKKSDFREL